MSLILRGPVLGEESIVPRDGVARAARDRLPAETAAAVFRLRHSYSVGYVSMEIARQSVDPARYEDFEARRYPTRAAVAAHLGKFGEAQFEAGLDVIVGGIEALVATRSGGPRRRRR